MRRLHGRIMTGLFLLPLLCAVSACRKKDVHEGDPVDDVDTDSLLLEQKRIASGEHVGEMLRTPTMVVTKTDIFVNGVRIGARSDLSPSVDAGRLWIHGGKVTSVYDRLRGLREHWKVLYPGTPYAFEADVTLQDDLSIAEGRNLLTTIAYAGYAAMTIHADGITAAFTYWLLGPPQPDDAPPPRSGAVIDTSAGISLRRLKVPSSWNDPERQNLMASEPPGPRSARGPEGFWERCGPVREASAASLEADLSVVCEGTCSRLDLVTPENARLLDALRVLVRAGNVSSHRFEAARFVATNPCADPPHEEVPPLPPEAKDWEVKVSTKRLSLDLPAEGSSDAGTPGGKATDAARAVVNSGLPRVLACYAEAATHRPAPGGGLGTIGPLHGTLTVKLVLDRNGAPVQGSKVSSTFYDERATACIIHSLHELQFARDNAFAALEITFDLAPKNAPPDPGSGKK